MLSGVIAWTARVCLALSLVTVILPVVPVGAWYVRLCDFPRIQLAVFAGVPLGLALLHGLVFSWRLESLVTILMALAVGLWQLAHVLPYTPVWQTEVPSADGAANAFRVLVANVEIGNSQKQQVLETIESHNPDLLLLVEVDQKWLEALAPLREVMPHTVDQPREEGLGISLWSRYPLREADVEHLVSERRASIHADVKLPSGELVHFVGIHPTPPGLMDSTNGGRRDSRVRDAELVLVAKRVVEEPELNWIVTGDFNDVAWSHTTRLFKRVSGLKDPRIGRQLLNTYHAEYPAFRYPIDHVFLAPKYRIKHIARVVLPGSDHFGIVADLTLTAGKPVDTEVSEDDRKEAEELVEEGKEDAEKRGVEAK